jgi:hypothetical protein
LVLIIFGIAASKKDAGKKSTSKDKKSEKGTPKKGAADKKPAKGTPKSKKADSPAGMF